MKKLILLVSLLFLAGCAGAQKVTITETEEGLEYEQAEPGKFEAEKTKDGWKVKSDTKNEPFKLLDTIEYTKED